MWNVCFGVRSAAIALLLALAIPTRAAVPVWTAPVPVDPAPTEDAYLPSIAYGNGAWVLVCGGVDLPLSPGVFGEDVFVQRSLDNGATWGQPLKLTTTTNWVINYAPHIATDGKGTWVVVWFKHQSLDRDRIMFSRSTDNGVTWSAPQQQSIWGGRNPYIACDGQDSWAVVYPGDGVDGQNSLVLNRSGDNGLTWTSQILNFNTPDKMHDGFARIATNGSGTWVLGWYVVENSGGGGSRLRAYYSRSADAGASWSLPQRLWVPGEGPEEYVTGIAANGPNWLIAWGRGVEFGTSYISRSMDDGLTLEPPVPLSSIRVRDIATDGSGNWCAMGTPFQTAGPYARLSTWSQDDGSTWSAPVPIGQGEFLTLGANRDGQWLSVAGHQGVLYQNKTTAPILADLSVSKSHEPEVVLTGTDVTFTLEVVNHGPADATDVVLADYIPAGMNVVSADVSQGSVVTSTGGAIASLGSLAAGTTATMTVVTKITAAGPATLVNTAVVSALQEDPEWRNDYDADPVQVRAEVDLAVSKAVSTSEAYVGQLFTYTVTVHNNGPNMATSLTVEDILPAGFDLVTSGPSLIVPVVLDGGVLRATVSTLSSGGTFTMNITGRINTPGPATNTVSATSSGYDANPTDNTASVAINILPAADLQISKSAAPVTVVPGEQVTYSLTVTNQGPSEAAGVVVTDALPAGLNYVSGSTSQGTVAHAGGTVTANLGVLAAGQTATVTIVASAEVPGEVTNSASVAASTHDPATANNTASVAITVAEAGDLPDLAISLTGVTVRNAGRGRTVLMPQFSITNIGTAPVRSAYGVRFYLSADQTVSPDDTTLRILPFRNLRPGQSMQRQVAMPLPFGTSAAGKYVIGIADWGAKIAESREDNNTAVFGPLQ
jgi:uncharacterized repeat protein (TIGR01451 family)